MIYLLPLLVFVIGVIFFVQSRKQKIIKIESKTEILKHLTDREKELQESIHNKSVILNEYCNRIDGSQKLYEEKISKLEEGYQEKLTLLENDYSRRKQEALDKYTEQCRQNESSYSAQELKYEQELSNLQSVYDVKKGLVKDEYQKILKQKEELQKSVLAGLEAAKRAEEITKSKKFYTINISDADLEEINKIRNFLPSLKNKRPICKAIWETYYRDATNDLINRLQIKANECGIYKITNLSNSKIYIGQSVNVSERFKQHIKCGLGIDTTNSRLYQEMLAAGVENFSFELLESCSKDQLNDKEKYWIAFYHSNDYGLNMTKGGS